MRQSRSIGAPCDLRDDGVARRPRRRVPCRHQRERFAPKVHQLAELEERVPGRRDAGAALDPLLWPEVADKRELWADCTPRLGVERPAGAEGEVAPRPFALLVPVILVEVDEGEEASRLLGRTQRGEQATSLLPEEGCCSAQDPVELRSHLLCLGPPLPPHDILQELRSP